MTLVKSHDPVMGMPSRPAPPVSLPVGRAERIRDNGRHERSY
ncbi:hypothetical protein OG607_30320 [Streptomyces sp. NBC_01537]